jgi:hypothetical protein
VIEPDELPAQADSYWKQKLLALLFRYAHGGLVEWQLRPDDPGDGPKYVFREGSEPPLNQVRDDGGHSPILPVEGSKQQWAAASYADPDLAIYGMFGCWSATSGPGRGRRISYISGTCAARCGGPSTGARHRGHRARS